jgi:hypothetical protein
MDATPGSERTAGAVAPVFDAAAVAPSDSAATSAGPASTEIPSPNAAGGKTAPFEQSSGDAGASARDAGRKPSVPPTPHLAGGIPGPHVVAPAPSK